MEMDAFYKIIQNATNSELYMYQEELEKEIERSEQSIKEGFEKRR